MPSVQSTLATGASLRNRLRIPTNVSAVGLTPTAARGNVDLGSGQVSSALMYNGRLPGPTIRANRGSTASIVFQNRLDQPSITHWHGLQMDHEDDGHPRSAVPPGGSYAYSFVVAQRASLNWYLPHPHMMTGEQVYHGLAGAFIVRDSEEASFGLPSGACEVPLIIRDASFDAAGNLKFGAKSSGFLGSEPMVNGTRAPYLPVNRALYRLRVLNGCNARVLRLALGGMRFFLIGNDGGLLTASVPLTEITMAPGERADLLVDFRTLEAAATVTLQCLDAAWGILEFRGTGNTVPSAAVPPSLAPIAPLPGPQQPTRTFSFDGMTRINGKAYDTDAVEFTVPRDAVERWRFVTGGNAPHPVHVHGASFQVQSRSGGRGQVFPWERGWKDTVLLADNETVDVFIRFRRSGLYLLHCATSSPTRMVA